MAFFRHTLLGHSGYPQSVPIAGRQIIFLLLSRSDAAPWLLTLRHSHTHVLVTLKGSSCSEALL